MKILVVYRAVDGMAGGVERISSWLMNELINHGHQVEFITFDKANAVSFYPLDKKIEWHRLVLGDTSRKANIEMRLKRVFAIRKIIKKFGPDVAIGFQEASYLSTRLAAFGLKIPIIAAERNSPSRFLFMPKTKIYLAFLSFIFSRFITVQSPSFPPRYPAWLRPKIRVIPNPVFQPNNIMAIKKNIILSVGRLEYQKNFTCLISAFSDIAAEFSEWSLVIVGDGSDRASLQALIKNRGLENRIRLENTCDDLSNFYREAKIFCLPSRWEGFPNGLAEALSYGLPSVGFEECDGINDLIKNLSNGVLAAGNNNSLSLANALSYVIRHEKLRDEMSKNAILSIRAYEPQAIFAEWENLFREAIIKK